MSYDWELYKEVIHQLYIVERKSWPELRVILKEDHPFQPSHTAFYRYVKTWNFESKKASLYKNEALVKRVTELWHYNLSHNEILQILNDSDYPEVADRALKELRLHHRLVYSNRGEEAKQNAEMLAQEYVRKHLESGQPARYGIVYTHTNVRLAENTFVRQHQIREALRMRDPVRVQPRTQDLHRQRGRYIVKGPNRVWSVDGHDKLADFGFQIYGFLDAYSRFILGVYIDMGTETVLITEFPLLFRREQKPNLSFHKAYGYGTSMKNQRIEAWWNLMATGQMEQWKILFETYRETGLFDGSKYDKIALQFLYMPVIRHQIHQFVWIHNTHAIRRQRNREFYLPTGKPYKMYHHPLMDIRNYACSPSSELMTRLEEKVQGYDLDEYLTGEIMSLCIHLLHIGNYPLQFDFGGQDTTNQRAYTYLRTALYNYEQNHGPVTELETPIGATEWINRHAYEQEPESSETFQLDPTDSEHEDTPALLEKHTPIPLFWQPGDLEETMEWPAYWQADNPEEAIEWSAYNEGLGDDEVDTFGDDGLLLNL